MTVILLSASTHSSVLRMEGARALGQEEAHPGWGRPPGVKCAAGRKPEDQCSPKDATRPGWGGSGDCSSCWLLLGGTGELGLRITGEFWVLKFKEEDGKARLHFFLQSSHSFTVGLVPQSRIR